MYSSETDLTGTQNCDLKEKTFYKAATQPPSQLELVQLKTKWQSWAMCLSSIHIFLFCLCHI
jgi:hypothetical protein